MAERFKLPPPGREPIYEFATPVCDGAIATLLLDGDGLLELLAPLFRSKRALTLGEPGQLVLGRLVDASGAIVDEAIAAPLAPEASETGNAQVELSCHGGRGATQAVRALLDASGFRAAYPGELFARAHRAARLSLLAIEARLRLARAETARQAEVLLAAGDLQARWERLGFEVAFAARTRQDGWQPAVLQAARAGLASAGPARAVLRTHALVLAGPVNAGKSTLANRLLRSEQLIVSAQPGTTRDVVERAATLRGLAVVLRDTAGLRGAESSDEIEREGQARARASAGEAALVLAVLDASRAPTEAEAAVVEELARRPSLLVLNKADRGVHAEAEGLGFALNRTAVRVSALTGEGLDALEAAIEAALLGGEAAASGSPFTMRQVHALLALQNALEEGLDAGTALGHIRDLCGIRPNDEALLAVFREEEERG